MTDEPHADAIPAQDPHQLFVKSARGRHTFKGSVNGLDAVKRAVVAFLNEFGTAIGMGGEQRCESGQIGVGLLGFGTE